MPTGLMPLALWTPGPWEVIIVLAILLLLFGRRLPEVMRNIGRGLTAFKKGMRDSVDEVKSEISEDGKAEKPSEGSDAAKDGEKPAG